MTFRPRRPLLLPILLTFAFGLLAQAGAADASGTMRSASAHRATHRLCRAHKHARRHRHSCASNPRAHPSSHGRIRAHSHDSHGHGRSSAHHRAPAQSAHQPAKSNAALLAGVLASPCENTELTPEEGNLPLIAAATLCLVNQERASHGELPLHQNGQLEQAATEHSQEMVSLDYFAHISPSGLTPAQRVQATGYVPESDDGYVIGENIAWGTLQLSTPKAIVAAWIASPEHLANILEGEYRDTAIGVTPAAPPSLAHGQSGAVYAQEFGVIIH
jgi:uncharacterized protein YkwD